MSTIAKFVRQHRVYVFAGVGWLSLIAVLSWLLVILPTSNYARTVGRWQVNKPLIVAVRLHPGLFEQNTDTGDFFGIEADLLQAFSDQQDIPIEYILVDKDDDVISVLTKGQAMFSTALLSQESSFPPEKIGLSMLGPIWTDQYVLVARAGVGIDPGKLCDVVYSDHLAMSVKIKELMQALQIGEAKKRGEDSLSLMLGIPYFPGRCVLTDTYNWKLAHYVDPTLMVLPSRAAQQNLVWLINESKQPELAQALKDFLQTQRRDGMLSRLYGRYMNHLNVLDQDALVEFHTLVARDLSRWRKIFEAAAKQHQLDWRLLAAVAYQESHWQPMAISSGGAQGFMQLTSETAKLFKLHDRFDAKASIFAGANYLTHIKTTLLSDVDDPDKTWLALLVYNMGDSALNKGAVLTKKLGLDDSVWQDIEFSLLKGKGMSPQTREAVGFVRRVRAYYEILCRRYPRINDK